MTRSKRKWDHIRLALKTGRNHSAGFDDVDFIHQSLPGTGISQVQLDHFIGGLKISSPFFINAMTGGGGDRTFRLNKKLATAARETGLPMAVGSQMSAVRDPSEAYTYEIVRKVNPDGIIIANIGSEASTVEALAAVSMIKADALQIHLNTIQELAMPEGDRDFSHALQRIESIARESEVPVIVKEVGFGMSRDTILALSSAGIRIADIGGYGGTNFAQIENKRSLAPLPFFDNWGIPSAISLFEAKDARSDIQLIGSGGIGTAIDAAKAISIGADAIGIAGPFLKTVIEGDSDSLIEQIKKLQLDLKLIMVALGAETIGELQQAPLIVSGKTFQWLSQREICTKFYANRSIARLKQSYKK